MHRSVSGQMVGPDSGSGSAGAVADDDDSFDFEAAQSVPSVASLSSAEHQFDCLMQQLTYRDKAKFIAYVRREVEAASARDGSNAGANSVAGSSMQLQPDSPQKPHLSLHASSLSRVSHRFVSVLSPWWRSVLERFALLGVLLFLQSLSSLILSHFAAFIQTHVIVTLYLTMLVGAGGNAGNQAAVMVIRSLAMAGGRSGSGGVSAGAVLWRESVVALAVGGLMMVVGFARVFLFEGGDWAAASAITLSLWCIVTSSIVLGAALPLLLHKFRLDPAHAGPCIQVLMDVLGVALTCCICSMVLGNGTTRHGAAPALETAG